MTPEYEAFLTRKQQDRSGFGFAPLWMPDWLKDFQQHLTEWNLMAGRSALLADCGLGKTPMQLVWAENIVRRTNRPVLVLTFLAVAQQTVREGAKFGIDCRRSTDGRFSPDPHIVVANYDRLHLFNPLDFAGVVCDESSAIKAFNGRLRAQVTEFLRQVPYRLLATATAAPNDYTELGTASEALGNLGLTDMLTRFFVNDQNNVSVKRAWAAHGGGAPKWRFKGHAPGPFWRWVCSWARACRKPSDLGFSDEGYILPALIERDHVVGARSLPEGVLFPVPAVGMREEREERRRTLKERCEKAATLVEHDRPAVVWCDLNPEGDLLERMIPEARQVKGSTPHEEKEEIFEAFSSGGLRVLVLKPKIGAWGLNWEHCSHVVTFPNHSFEQDYQKLRRCWRFGQTREVVVDRVLTEGEVAIRASLHRKSLAADRMFTELVAHMNEATRLNRTNIYRNPLEVPTWL